MRLRIVSWNVNGLRRIIAQFGSLEKFLNALEADILCIQEHKLTRPDFKRELALADGWESFFAFTRGRVGYSGVATFCRRAPGALPLAAEEGFTGALNPATSATAATVGVTATRGASSGYSTQPPPAIPLPHSTAIPQQQQQQQQQPGSQHPTNAAASAVAAAQAPTVGAAPGARFWRSSGLGLGPEALRALDGEGRVVITDHGALVLVNVYGPAITSEERAEERGAFKMSFFRALQHRLDGFLEAGRRVVVLGDFNISPAPRDRAGATPRNWEPARPDRLWLNALLRRGRARQGGNGGGAWQGQEEE